MCSLVPLTFSQNLYNTDPYHESTILQYDCLDYYVYDNIVQYNVTKPFAHRLIGYCVRPTNNSEREMRRWKSDNKPLHASSSYNFKTLRDKQITSQQLLAWSTSIELPERYEMYLINDSVFNGLDLYYNCTRLWFGDMCEYAFSLFSEITLRELVYHTFEYKSEYTPADVPCYRLLEVRYLIKYTDKNKTDFTIEIVRSWFNSTLSRLA